MQLICHFIHLTLALTTLYIFFMTTSLSHISSKRSEGSSQNTRDISLFSNSKLEISTEECLQLDYSSPLKDLDKGGQKIPYSELKVNDHLTLVGAKNSINDGFFRKFKQELKEKVNLLFKSVKRGDLQLMRKIMKEYPIPISVREEKYFDNTLLHHAIKFQQIEISLTLIKLDISLLNQQNNEGRTPVHYAMMYLKQLFLALLENHSQQIDWALKDNNNISYTDYAQYHNYEFSIFEKIKQLVFKATPVLKNQKSLFSIPKFIAKKSVPEPKYKSQIPKSKTLNSNILQKKRRFSSDFIKNTFSNKTNLQDFIILNELGEGSFAKVYKVKHIENGQIYAMKVFQKKSITHQTMRYIISQKDILMKLNHPFLIKIFCAFQTPYVYCYIMECCEGTLRDLLNQKKQLSQNCIKLIACELTSILGYLHSNGIMYRDLKPENIGYDQYGHICLIDFGLAKSSSLSNSFCGSYLYLPPEMISSKPYSYSVDWYMLGVTLYELSSGKTPFIELNKDNLFKKIVQEKHKPLLGVSIQMSDFVDGLLQKDLLRRLGSAQDSFDLMDQPWFDDIEWNSIPRRRYKIFDVQPSDRKPSINMNAQIYFQTMLLGSSLQFNFIQVSRWTSTKELP